MEGILKLKMLLKIPKIVKLSVHVFMEVANILNSVMADDDGVKRVSVEEHTLQAIQDTLDKQKDVLKRTSENLEAMVGLRKQDTERMRSIIDEKDAIILEKETKIQELQEEIYKLHETLLIRVQSQHCAPSAPAVPSVYASTTDNEQPRPIPQAVVSSKQQRSKMKSPTSEIGCSGHDAEGKAKRARSTQQHTASYAEVTQAFLQCEPLFGVSGWRFKDSACSKEFWTTMINLPVFADIDEGKRLKSVKKTLNGVGYDHVQDDSAQKTTGETWETASAWQWDCVKAMINCYWLNTTVMLDPKVKNMLKIIHCYYKKVARTATPVMNLPPMLCKKSVEDLKPLVNNLFAFKTDKTKKMCVEKRKMQELEDLNTLLVDFEKQGKIVEVTFFRPWHVISADEEEELKLKLN